MGDNGEKTRVHGSGFKWKENSVWRLKKKRYVKSMEKGMEKAPRTRSETRSKKGFWLWTEIKRKLFVQRAREEIRLWKWLMRECQWIKGHS